MKNNLSKLQWKIQGWWILLCWRSIISKIQIWIFPKFTTGTCDAHLPKTPRPEETHVLVFRINWHPNKSMFEPCATSDHGTLHPAIVHHRKSSHPQFTIVHHGMSFYPQRPACGPMQWQRCQSARILLREHAHLDGPLRKCPLPLMRVLVATQSLGAEEFALAVVAREDSWRNLRRTGPAAPLARAW